MNFKIIFLIFLTIASLYAENDKLKVYSKIALKTLFYDFNFKKKTFDNKINFAIIYSNINEKKAIDLKKYLMQNSQSLNDLTLEVKLIHEDELYNLKDITCIYIFNIKDDNLKKIVSYATNNQLLTFTSATKNIGKGVNLLFDFQKEIEIFANKKSIQDSQIEFKSTFLKAIKIYDNSSFFIDPKNSQNIFI